MTSDSQFYPLEINGTRYLLCKLPDHTFSTLHDPETKQIVGEWNNDAAHYEIFPTNTNTNTNPITDEQFHQHMRQLIKSGIAFTFH